MDLSFWERDTWLTNVDYTIIGSGIVGLNCALSLRKRFPKAKILVLERGFLPNGASTKNAGFACFGSLSEILSDLNTHSEEEVLELIEKRLSGLRKLRENLGDSTIGYFRHGGYEMFTPEEEALFEKCRAERGYINNMLLHIFGEEVFEFRKNPFGFKNVKEQFLFNKFEGQINTGRMMAALLQKAQSQGIKILNNITVQEFEEGNQIAVKTDKFQFKTAKLFITTNGFSFQMGIEEVKPARAQVLITEPIDDLQIKGTFHLGEGYYYFRNIDNRILLGGGRNLDLKAEETIEMDQTELVQKKLDQLLHDTILPDREFKVAHRWSGIMGVGKQKKPIVKQVSENTFCGVRLGGMGIAIGSKVGEELADLI